MKLNYQWMMIIGILFVLSTPAFPKIKAHTTGLLGQTAKFLSGRPVEDKGLQKLAGSKSYKDFVLRMDSYWTNYEKTVVEPIQAWQREWLSNDNYDTCFYPFAGADFINAYLMYPEAKAYVLIGLETAGLVPDLAAMPAKDIQRGLQMLSDGYRVFMRWNFYRTLSMAIDMQKSPFKGTLPHMLSQMGWLGLEPKAVYEVEVNPEGLLTFGHIKPGRACQSAAIDFSGNDGTVKRVIFIHLDLENKSLEKQKAWSSYLNNLTNMAGVMKAASYLPPRKEFSIIRGICLSNMDVLVQDDSGIPYKYLKEGWEITLFGTYNGPHPIFPGYGQKDLKEAYLKEGPLPLKFRFCYNMLDNANNLMLVRKKK